MPRGAKKKSARQLYREQQGIAIVRAEVPRELHNRLAAVAAFEHSLTVEVTFALEHWCSMTQQQRDDVYASGLKRYSRADAE